MEQSTPHCKLAAVKVLVSAGQVRTTRGAREGAVYLKLTVIEDVLVVSLKEL